MQNKKIVLFESEDKELKLDVSVDKDTVWLNAIQMAELFGRNVSTIRRHVANSIKEELAGEVVCAEFASTTLHGALGSKTQTHLIQYYNLDVIISVGYRVKSKRGIEFRKWANNILRKYILEGYAVNKNRLQELGSIVKVLKKSQNKLNTGQVLDIFDQYAKALNMLDDYDHHNLTKPKGKEAIYVLKYDECRKIINSMIFMEKSDLFGVEKDDSFKGSIRDIYQTFGGKDIYPTLEEKAANLLYFITKNHSFLDGNKRIAATIFLYFLDKNKVLFKNGAKSIDDYALASLTILIAESMPSDKDTIIKLIMNVLD